MVEFGAEATMSERQEKSQQRQLRNTLKGLSMSERHSSQLQVTGSSASLIYKLC